MDDLLLREICKLTGVTRRAVQGYEKEGLIASSGKNNKGYLLYDARTTDDIKRIKLFQQRGFSLKEIKTFPELNKEDFKFTLIQKVFELQKKQSQLKSVAMEIQAIIAEL